MRKRILFIAVLFQILLVSNAFADTTQITNGLGYLTSSQSTDGSWTSGDESVLTSAEVIKTLRLLNQTSSSGYTLAVSWMQNQSPEATHHLADRIYILAAAGTDSPLLVSYLDELVRAWGGYDDFVVNNLDTAFALQALQAVNYTDQTVIQTAISYLVANQNTDGGWGFDSGDASNIYMTSIVSRALQHFSQTTAMATAVAKATSFIISRQNSDGGFGSSVYETALAYIALVAVTTDNTVLGNAAQFITKTQATDGSWDEDPYVTALALQVLYYSANKPAPPTAALAIVTGTVIDSFTNALLKGASAVLQSNTAINATSDASGVFTLINVPGGSQQIAVSFAGYTTSTVTVNATEGAVINLGNIPLSVNASTGIVKGTVTDASTGQPLSGVTVSLSGAYTATTTTGTDGSFIFTDVTPGSITIEASFAGYSTSTGLGSVTAGGVLLFSPRLSTDAQTGTTGTLTGTIVAGSSSTPVVGAVVTVDGTTAASSDSNGVFSIGDLAAGTHQVAVTASGYSSSSYSVVISAGGTMDMGIIALTSLAGSSSTITGVVTDSSTSKPIASADVSVVGTSLSTKTASDGSYSISGIGQLQFSVRVSASGYNSKTVSTSMAQYGAYAMNFALDQSNAGGLKITSMTLDNTAYTANSNVSVNAVLENTNSSLFNVYAYLKIIDSQNNVVGMMSLYESSYPLSIDPNSSVPISGTCNVRRNTPGNYSLLLSVTTTEDRNILAESRLPFTIIPTVALENTALEIEPRFVDVSVPQNIAISASFNNRSNMAATVKARYEVKDIGGSIIKDGELDIPLSVNDDVVTVTLTSLSYTFNQSGQYPVTLKILSGDAIIAEATDSIFVAPPFRLQPLRTYTPESVLPGIDKPVNVDVKLKGMVTPVIVSAASDNTGNKIFIHFNKTMADPSGMQTQFSIIVDGSAVPVSSAALNPSDSAKIDLLLQLPVLKGQTILLNYTAGNLASAEGIQISDVTNYMVTNNAQNLIFNQDGFGSSGIIRGNPLKANIAMTGYNSWPTGLTRGTYAFVSGVSDGQNIWMIPRSANMVIKADKDTGDMTGYNNWPSGFTAGSDMFASSVFDGQNIWMIPLSATQVIKIDKDTGSMTGYNSWPTGFTKGTLSFIGGVFDGQNIWMIPYDASKVIKVDKDTGVMTAYNNWPSGFSKGSHSFQGAVFDGQNIWMIPFNADRVIKIDKDTGVMTGYNNWPSGFTKKVSAFAGGTFDGQNIWLIPHAADRVIKIDKDTGAMTGYNNWPSGFSKGSTDFAGGVFDGQNIWMIPLNADRVIKIDKDTSAMTGYNRWPLGYVKSGHMFYGGVFDGQNIWLVTSSNTSDERIIKLSSGSDTNSYMYDAAIDFSGVNNPNGVWSYGWSSTLYSDLTVYPSVGSSKGIFVWTDPQITINAVPSVACNTTGNVVSYGVTANPYQLWFHPGPRGEFSHIRWTAPAEGTCSVETEFKGIASTTTDVHISHNTTSVFDDTINGNGNKKNYSGTIAVNKGDIIDFAVGIGNGHYFNDSTAVDIRITYLPKQILKNVRVIDTVSNTNIDLDASSFSKTPSTITAGTDSTVIEWQYDNINANEIENLNYNILLKSPVAEENRLVNNKLEVLYADATGKQFRTELPASYVKVLASAFNSAIATDKASYQANEDVLINANIISKSGYSRTIDAKILIEDSQGVLVTQAAYLTGLNFAAGETKALDPVTFNTGSTLAGTYRAHIILYDSQAIVGEALANFTIAQPSASASVTSGVSTDKMSYQANEVVTVTSTVQNTSANFILNNLTAKVTIADPNGSALHTESTTIQILTPGQLSQLKFYWNTATNTPGAYSVKLEIFDGVNLLGTSVTSFSIAGTSGTGGTGTGGFTSSSVQGTVSAAPNVIYAGNEICVGYTITNSGNENIPLLNVKIIVVDPVTQTVKTEITGQEAVAQGTTIIGAAQNNISTSSLVPGNYLVILQAATPSMTEFKTLSKTNFEVKAGLEITKTVLDTGNLLIWVNKKCDSSQGILNIFCFCDDDKNDVNPVLLENALKGAGVNYHIVYNKTDFQREMRNTSFTDYMILGDRYILDLNYADELRELIYSGKGLISSLYVKYGELGPTVSGALWAAYLLPGKYTVNLSDSAIAAASSFTTSGKITNVIAVSGATVAGKIKTILNSPAVVLNDYGQGRSVYCAFDLIETLNDQNYTQLAELIKNSITYVHKPVLNEASYLPGQLIPVEVKIKSLGGSFDLKIKETYPSEIRIYDPSTSQWITDNPWMKDIHIDTNAIEYFRYYAMTPDVPGIYTLTTDAGYMKNDTFQSYKTAEAEITVGNYSSAVLPDSIITALKALKPNFLEKIGINNAIKHIASVKTRNAKSAETKLTCQANITDILEATEDVMLLKSCDTTQVRLMMDMLMLIYEGKYYMY